MVFQIATLLKSEIDFCHFKTVLLVDKFYPILNKISLIVRYS